MRSSMKTMPGAASHMPLMGGWLARKSPPYAVSSRWTCGLSPSPLVLTEALRPPCAQTECERLTGTSENNKTGTFASHSRMTVINPASPPPTTITRRTAPDDVRTMFLVATYLILWQLGSRGDEEKRQGDRGGAGSAALVFVDPGSTTEQRSAELDSDRPGKRAPVAK